MSITCSPSCNGWQHSATAASSPTPSSKPRRRASWADQDDEPAFLRITSTGSSNVASAVTTHTSTVAATHDPKPDVERFFRTLNTELDVRPIRHRLADRVRAHMFLRMLSYYISWHIKQALAPILFADNDKPAAAAKRADPVAAAQRSDEALTKAARKRTADDYPVHSFTSLLADLATICANQIQPTNDLPAVTILTTPTPPQRRALELLGVSHRHRLA
jgi:hypothetical protein